MNASMLIGISIGIAISVCAGSAFWMLQQPLPVDEAPAPISERARREHAERFFSGDPDRNVRGGQEMRPRW
ncbi:entry exclusion protein TrbK (plasmid) [Aminobacter sp. SR38]|nr:entry exclusion protein TrbK [Aminobacter sp. SR38]